MYTLCLCPALIILPQFYLIYLPRAVANFPLSRIPPDLSGLIARLRFSHCTQELLQPLQGFRMAVLSFFWASVTKIRRFQHLNGLIVNDHFAPLFHLLWLLASFALSRFSSHLSSSVGRLRVLDRTQDQLQPLCRFRALVDFLVLLS